jgi:hypothetical protein
VVRLMTALPGMDVPPYSQATDWPGEIHARDDGTGCRPGFSLQIDRAEGIEQPVRQGEAARWLSNPAARYASSPLVSRMLKHSLVKRALAF